MPIGSASIADGIGLSVIGILVILAALVGPSNLRWSRPGGRGGRRIEGRREKLMMAAVGAAISILGMLFLLKN
jgi:hypothetical protein